MKRVYSQLLVILLLIGVNANTDASLIIDFTFQGEVNEVIDRKEPFFSLLTPVGTEFSGIFRFHDASSLWPNPGNYTTPNTIFNIDFDTGFSITIDHYQQTFVYDRGGYYELHVYGYTAIVDDEQWTFGIGGDFTVDEATGSIEYETPWNLGLDVSVGGHYPEGPPEVLNSVVYGQAYEIGHSVVSEPSTMILLGTGLVSLAGARLRKKLMK